MSFAQTSRRPNDCRPAYYVGSFIHRFIDVETRGKANLFDGSLERVDLRGQHVDGVLVLTFSSTPAPARQTPTASHGFLRPPHRLAKLQLRVLDLGL